MGASLYEEEWDTSRLHHDRIVLYVEISSICICIGLFIISIYLVVINIVGVGIGLAIISSGYCLWSINEVRLDLAPRLFRIIDDGIILKSNILLNTKRHKETFIHREKIKGVEIAYNIKNHIPYLIEIQYVQNSKEDQYLHIQLCEVMNPKSVMSAFIHIVPDKCSEDLRQYLVDAEKTV